MNHYYYRGKSVPKVIAIASGKGGVGKTVVSTMLGMCLANLNKKVILVDADFHGSNLHYLFSAYDKTHNLRTYFKNHDRNLNRFVCPTLINNFSILFGQSSYKNQTTLNYHEKWRLIRNLRKLDADYVLLDIGPGNSYSYLDLFLCADHRLLISTVENTSLYSIYQFIRSAIFRRIQYSQEIWKSIDTSIKRCGDLTMGKNVQTLKSFLESCDQLENFQVRHIRNIANRIKPGLIVNAVQENDTGNTVQALRLACNQVLSSKLSIWGTIRFDLKIKRAIQHNQPEMLLDSELGAFNDVSKMVQRKVISEKLNPVNKQYFTSGHYSTEKRNDSEIRICNHRCIAWNCCEKRYGGIPCAIFHPEYQPEVHFNMEGMEN